MCNQGQHGYVCWEIRALITRGWTTRDREETTPIRRTSAKIPAPVTGHRRDQPLLWWAEQTICPVNLESDSLGGLYLAVAYV